MPPDEPPSALPLRAAFVGLGWWGRTLAEAAERGGRITAAACVSLDEDESRAFAARFGARPAESLESVLEDPAVDAVVLATPHSLHASQVIAAARAGKHVFVEKPLTLTSADAPAAVEACRKAGVRLAVGHNRRLLPQVALMADLLREGRCGEILHVEANFSTPEGLAFAPGHWRASRAECPGGGMTVLGVHVIDWLHALFGPVAEVAAVFARRAVRTDSDDTASARLTFRSGVTATLVSLYAAPYANSFVVHGSERRIAVTAVGSESAALRPTFTIADLDGHVEAVPLPFADTLRLQLEAFADLARRPAVTGEEGAQNVAVLDAIVRSAAAGGRPQAVDYGEAAWIEPAIWRG